MACPRCQHENAARMKFCGECGTPLTVVSSTARSYADLKREVERLGGALTEALEQQTAKVKQILLNLLSNAVKFTREGGRVGLTATATDRVVTIAVSDTGVGIAPEDQAAIFEEFRQVGRDNTRKQEGTGLGLTLAKKFVELHGGRICVESQVGQGRRSASRCRFGAQVRFQRTTEEARRHGHDVSPVPRSES